MIDHCRLDTGTKYGLVGLVIPLPIKKLKLFSESESMLLIPISKFELSELGLIFNHSF